MNNLYTRLSEVYEAMYHTFINYEDELDFYSALLKKYNCPSVLEMGCGTGNLAEGFITKGFAYWGMDLSPEMLRIAKRNHPQGRFLEGDMRNFEFTEKPAACIITGRTISYLLTNKDVLDTFTSIRKKMLAGGILCFDFIDANKFLPYIKERPSIVHEARCQDKKFYRDSYWQMDPAQSWTVKWKSEYYEQNDNGRREKIGDDNSTIRAFCHDDIILFLELSGFQLKEKIARPSYAFDTIVIVAEST